MPYQAGRQPDMSVEPRWVPLKVGTTFNWYAANGKWRRYRCDEVRGFRAICHPLTKKQVTIKGRTFYALDGPPLRLDVKATVLEYLPSGK